MIIACATDRNYTELAGVLISSIITNGNVPEATITICDYNLRSSDRKKLNECAKDRKLEFITIDDKAQAILSTLRRTAYWSRAMYSRLLLPDILSEQEGRILYLDSDMLVLGDLRPLFALPLDGCVIGAVRDPAKPHNIAKRNRAIGNAEDAPYLNSGTLLIDIKKWKQDNVGTRCFEYLKSPGRKEFPDQDALNVVLAGKWKQIDRRWNFTEGENRLFSEEHFRQAYIIHFTGKKPNLAHCVHPAQTIYLDQRKKTPWANRPLVSNTRRRIHRLYRKLDLAWERYIVVPLRAPFRGS